VCCTHHNQDYMLSMCVFAPLPPESSDEDDVVRTSSFGRQSRLTQMRTQMQAALEAFGQATADPSDHVGGDDDDDDDDDMGARPSRSSRSTSAPVPAPAAVDLKDHMFFSLMPEPASGKRRKGKKNAREVPPCPCVCMCMCMCM
jgi:hypothetical protein